MKKTEQLSNNAQQSSVENQEEVSTPRNETNNITIPVTPDQPIDNSQEPPKIKQQRREAIDKAQQEKLRLGL